MNYLMCTIKSVSPEGILYEPQIENKINASSVNRLTANKRLKAAKQFPYILIFSADTQSRFSPYTHAHTF